MTRRNEYSNTYQDEEWYRMTLKLSRYRHLLSVEDEKLLETIANKIPNGLR